MMKTNTNLFFSRSIWENLLYRKGFYVVLFSTLCIISCNKSDAYAIRPFKVEKGWGYIISIDNKIVIRQSVIPAVAENKSFQTQKEALKTANLVVGKLRQNLPPTITKKDLILLEIAL